MIESALEYCPQATTWAQHFVARPWSGGNDFGRARSHIVRVAVPSLSAARGSDDLFCELLELCIDDTRCSSTCRMVDAPAEWTHPPASTPLTLDLRLRCTLT